MPRHLLACGVLIALGCAPGVAQQFTNFEIPQVRPITVASLSGRDYLLVCNTPDNSVEIYDAFTLRFIVRVPVGLGPASVFYSPAHTSFYTANFLGDSVTRVSLVPPAGGQPLRARLVATSYVGDEPADIALMPDGLTLMVTLSGYSSYALVDVLTLEPPGGNPDLLRILATVPFSTLGATEALNAPRRIIIRNNDMMVLNFKGGNGPTYDLDLYALDFATLNETVLRGLGSMNSNMRFGADGRLYVVGGLARSEVIHEPNVAAVPTGFVESRLWVVDNPLSGSPQVRSRDLNRDATGSVVPRGKALAQPMDVALLESGNQVIRIFVAGFASDRVGIIEPNAGPPSTWPMRSYDVPPYDPSEYGMAGPRGLVMRYDTGAAADPGTRLYCLNRLDNSVAVIDPNGDSELIRFPLRNDPTPKHIRLARRFLYSADLSGGGFVSCGSCHIDGRSDSIGWNLGDPSAPNTPFPANRLLIDGMALANPTPSSWVADKGILVTQSLQGLMTYPINEEAQSLFTTEPLHWRGDRLDFTDFNAAYVSLMGAPDIGTGNPMGIPGDDMSAFKRLIASMVPNPNPNQPIDRRYGGNLGTPGLEDGSGAQRGMKLFHTRGRPGAATGGRSCVQCHFLPDGSNNRLTTAVLGPNNSIMPLEPAELRTMYEREGILEYRALNLSTIRKSAFGITHTGQLPFNLGGQLTVLPLSINWFNFIASLSQFPDLFKLVDVIDFLRQIDTGVAPIVGQSLTIDSANAGSVGVTTFFNLAETQVAEASAGLAAILRTGDLMRGFYYDLTASPVGYREEGTSTVLSRFQLLALLQTGDVLMLHATPLGDSRRVASSDGRPAPLAGPAPSNLDLQPAGANPAWESVPTLDKNWIVGTGPNDFNWDGQTLGGVPVPEPDSLKTIRIFQQALIANVPGGFGLTAQRHEAPRRFRVSGDDIRQGAVLQLRVPNNPSAPPPYADPTVDTMILEMPIHPTGDIVAGRRVWATGVEAEPLMVYLLMLGGPAAPGVQMGLSGQLVEPSNSSFDPQTWNLHHVTVVNEDGTSASPPAWQSIRLQ